MLENAETKTRVRGERLLTGLRGLDTLLNGGFIKGGTYLLLGPPGSGKTILGNQIAFHHVKEQSDNVVYITLLAESHNRMMDSLSVFNYFNESIIGRSVHYLSGYRALEKDGLKGLLKQIAEVVREKKASILIIDGITTVGDLDHSALAFRKFTHELNSFLSCSGCTTFLLSSMEGNYSRPEHTMVDGIVALHHENVGLRSCRQVEIRKFRGSSHLQGKHYFLINDHGIHVIPRIESVKPTLRQLPSLKKKDRLPFGIPDLDKMLGGGIITNSIATLIGAAGTGKTLLGLHFLQAGVTSDQQGLYFGFYESPDDLLEKASALKLDFHKSVAQGKIELLWHRALEQELDELGEILLEAVVRTKAKRVVIDGVDGFLYSASDPARINRFFVALVLELKALGVTVVLVEETSLFQPQGQRHVAELSALNETLIYLRNVDFEARMMRVISVLKIRSAIYDSTLREFTINHDGIRILSAVKSSLGILSSEAKKAGLAPLKGQGGKSASERRQSPAKMSKKRKTKG